MEIGRKIFHVIFGLVLISLLYFEIINKEILLGILILGVFVSLIEMRYKLPIVSSMLRIFDRDTAMIPGQGIITFVGGSLIVLYLFNLNVALAAIMVLTLGDSFCHLGRKGKIKNPFNDKKLVEGIIIGTVIAAIGAMIFVSWERALLGAFAAMLIESFDLKFNGRNIDDNLFIPLIAGIVFAFS